MAYDLALDLNGDLMFGSNRDLLGISGDPHDAQRIKVRLKIPRGEWTLDTEGTLGSRLESVVSRDPLRAREEIPIFVDEALNTMDDIEITGVEIDDVSSSGLSVIVGFRSIPIPDEDEPVEIPDDPDRPEATVAVSF
jgi:hypothetical protein